MASSSIRRQERNAQSSSWIASPYGLLLLLLLAGSGGTFHRLFAVSKLHEIDVGGILGSGLTMVCVFFGIAFNVIAGSLALMYLHGGYLLAREQVLLWFLVCFTGLLIIPPSLSLLDMFSLGGWEVLLYTTLFPLSGIIGVVSLLLIYKSEL